MFDRLKKAFAPGAKERSGTSVLQLHAELVSEWAAARGMTCSSVALGSGVSMQGKVSGRPWKLELGKPTRGYIEGEELRARAELGVDDAIAAMIISRPLKEALERKAYSLITDTLQTTASPNLPEEMRWLAMYDEIGWEGVDDEFWRHYAVLSDRREHARAWVDDRLVALMTRWPEPRPLPSVPFILVLLRGRCYLRMQYTSRQAQTETLEHVATIFTGACDNALGAFPMK